MNDEYMYMYTFYMVDDPVLVAQRVAARETIVYGDTTFRVELKTTMQSTTSLQHSLVTSSTAGEETKLDLEVTGIPEQTSEELIQLFFENEKRSSGGPVEKLKFDPETGTAVISFKDRQGRRERFFLPKKKHGDKECL